MIVVKILGGLLLALIVLIFAGLTAMRFVDGPIGPLAGGPLQAGPLVTGSVADWSFADAESVELQLVDPPRSRITGVFVHEGELYVPCDLGFIWRRVLDDQGRRLLGVIWWFKHWHEDALRDGRVVMRVAGKRYPLQAERVTDPDLLNTLRARIEREARAYFTSGLSDAPGDTEAIWFFHLYPRPAAAA